MDSTSNYAYYCDDANQSALATSYSTSYYIGTWKTTPRDVFLPDNFGRFFLETALFSALEDSLGTLEGSMDPRTFP